MLFIIIVTGIMIIGVLVNYFIDTQDAPCGGKWKMKLRKIFLIGNEWKTGKLRDTCWQKGVCHVR
jgi:hypothetical protein